MVVAEVGDGGCEGVGGDGGRAADVVFALMAAVGEGGGDEEKGEEEGRGEDVHG